MAPWAVWIERASSYSFIYLSIIITQHRHFLVVLERVCQLLAARVFLCVCKVMRGRHTRTYVPVPLGTTRLFFAVLTRAVISTVREFARVAGIGLKRPQRFAPEPDSRAKALNAEPKAECKDGRGPFQIVTKLPCW